jgi:hypothetical protein
VHRADTPLRRAPGQGTDTSCPPLRIDGLARRDQRRFRSPKPEHGGFKCRSTYRLTTFRSSPRYMGLSSGSSACCELAPQPVLRVSGPGSDLWKPTRLWSRSRRRLRILVAWDLRGLAVTDPMPAKPLRFHFLVRTSLVSSADFIALTGPPRPAAPSLMTSSASAKLPLLPGTYQSLNSTTRVPPIVLPGLSE